MDIHSILGRLSPNFPDPVHGWWIYIIIVLLFITMFMQRAGSALSITFLLAGAIMAGLIEKIQAFNHHPVEFLAFAMVMLMVVFPLVVAGMTKSPKSRLPAILATILSLVYLIVLWASSAA